MSSCRLAYKTRVLIHSDLREKIAPTFTPCQPPLLGAMCRTLPLFIDIIKHHQTKDVGSLCTSTSAICACVPLERRSEPAHADFSQLPMLNGSNALQNNRVSKKQRYLINAHCITTRPVLCLQGCAVSCSFVPKLCQKAWPPVIESFDLC